MSLRNWLLLGLLSLLWGGSFFFIDIALRQLNPITIVFFRISIAALVLTLVVYQQGKRLPKQLKQWAPLLLMGALNNVLPFCLLVWGQSQTNSSMASILNATTPLFTVLLAHFLTKDERLAWHKAAGISVGFIGVVVLMLPNLHQGVSAQGLGQFAILLAALSYACAGIWGKRLSHNGALVNSAGMLICSSILSFPLMIIFEGTTLPAIASIHLNTLLAMLFLAVSSTAIAYMLYFKILASAGATNVLLVTFLVPISAISLGVGILGEKLQASTLLGMGVVFSGLLLIDGRVLQVFSKKHICR